MGEWPDNLIADGSKMADPVARLAPGHRLWPVVLCAILGQATAREMALCRDWCGTTDHGNRHGEEAVGDAALALYRLDRCFTNPVNPHHLDSKSALLPMGTVGLRHGSVIPRLAHRRGN